MSMAAKPLRRYYRSGAELFDELKGSNQLSSSTNGARKKDLLQRLVVDKTGCIFRDLQLPFLDMLAELPREAC